MRWAERFSLGNDLIEAMLKNKMKSLHPGPLGQLKPLEDALLKYIFKQCKQGTKVSTFCIIVLASNLSNKFGKKHFTARCSAVMHFMHAHSLVYYQMDMHIYQCKPEEVEVEVSNYMHLIRPLLFSPHCNWHFILNMDHTGLFFNELKKGGSGGCEHHPHPHVNK
jgi:hypothetical protein